MRTVEGIRDRALGAVLGLALGDAIGAPFEFSRADAIPSPIPVLSRPWMGRPPGTWTDDTAMARNLWRSLVDRGGFDAADVLRRHLDWLATSPPDVGNQTRLALTEAGRGTAEAARIVFERRGPEVSAGNGSVMYCAPLGIAYAGRPEDLFDFAPALSAITHWDGRCRTACLAITLAAASLIRGEDRVHAVVNAVRAVAGRDGSEELEHLVGHAGKGRRVDGPDQGFTLFAAALGLQAAAEAASFGEGLLNVIALGGDTDTNGAVTGALLGARDGRSALPEDWVARLADREEIEREAEALASLAEREFL
jgi:ADP-ribosyl-[dinitrogen reductase] hydrolase